MQKRPILSETTSMEIEKSLILKIKKTSDSKIAAFNYKVIHNILINNVYLSKWLDSVTANCSHCKCEEDIIHMIYECSLNNAVWNITGEVLCIHINIKHVILGYGLHLASYNIYNNKYIKCLC